LVKQLTSSWANNGNLERKNLHVAFLQHLRASLTLGLFQNKPLP
jgi:hypothetical protein